MIEIYLTPTEKLDGYLTRLLEKYSSPVKILKTAFGKPYMAGNPVYFSVTHSGDKGAIALCDRPVGIDLEIFKGKSRKAVFARFTERERAEISNERDFLIHWTAKEAFIKMKGVALYTHLKRLEFYGGEIYLDGIKQNVILNTHTFAYGMLCVCAEE